MKLEILENSLNYTAQVIQLPAIQPVKGLDNLVKVTHQGNDCLIGKDSIPGLYLFFGAETQLSEEFCKFNNLFRDPLKNSDTTKTGFFEDTRRCKAIKFKGVVSSGFVIPVEALGYLGVTLQLGDEFNVINGETVCEKYVVKQRIAGAPLGKSSKVLDNIVDSKLAPEHFSTEHLLKNVHKLDLSDYVSITVKLHGTSARYFNTLTHRKLNWVEKLLKKFISIQTEEYSEVAGSRKVIKSVGFSALKNKSHFYKESGDIWTKVGEEYFKGKLNKGEAVYCEIIGKTHSGEAIQKGYSYGFEKPEVYIYRISNINPQGIEVDLSYHQMIKRAGELGVKVCPEIYYGRLGGFLATYQIKDDGDLEQLMSDKFYGQLLEKPSVLDSTVLEEGFCIRVDDYPKPHIFKIKSKGFLLHEGKLADKQITNIEDDTTN